MSIIRIGSNEKYADGWDKAFGKGKKTVTSAKTTASKKAATKKKSPAKKKSTKKKA